MKNALVFFMLAMLSIFSHCTRDFPSGSPDDGSETDTIPKIDTTNDIRFITPVHGETFSLGDTVIVTVSYNIHKTGLIGIIYMVAGTKSADYISAPDPEVTLKDSISVNRYTWFSGADEITVHDSVLLKAVEYGNSKKFTIIPHHIRFN